MLVQHICVSIPYHENIIEILSIHFFIEIGECVHDELLLLAQNMMIIINTHMTHVTIINTHMTHVIIINTHMTHVIITELYDCSNFLFLSLSSFYL